MRVVVPAVEWWRRRALAITPQTNDKHIAASAATRCFVQKVEPASRNRIIVHALKAASALTPPSNFGASEAVSAPVRSLDRDARAAPLAELLVDEQLTPETLAILRELRSDVRPLLKRISRDERRAVRMNMEGRPVAQIVELFGRKTPAAWRTARLRLRDALAGAPEATFAQSRQVRNARFALQTE